jgi:hypothetical protein
LSMRHGRFWSTMCVTFCNTLREEGWLRHQQIFGVANLSAADGVVAYEQLYV